MQSSRILLARRTWPSLLQKAKLKSPPNQKDNMNWQKLGSCGEGGLSRYELDFIEAAEWTKTLLLKMKNDAKTLK
ncbi:hypothetical protein HDU91_004613, partial [Kappamyces sp. JEL0680]